MPCLLIDNGAGSIKAGWYDPKMPSASQSPQMLPNSTAKVSKSMQYLIADQQNDFLNTSMLQYVRPFDRGYLTNWQCEIEVWSYLFQDKFRIIPQDSSLVLTEPLLNLETIQNDTNEVVFEYYGFKEYIRRPAAAFSAFSAGSDLGCLVVDSGFSFTHIVPFVSNRCVKKGIRRINIGGKLLTNYLKEMVSYRQWNMMDEFALMNAVKEELCYVSSNILTDMSASRALGRAARSAQMRDHAGQRLRKHYVLPDFQTINKGFVKPDDELIGPTEQVLVMETERMSVPELLFHPLDVGLEQAGLPEVTMQSLQALPLADQALASSKIILTGGNARFPNLQARYSAELRPMLPDLFTTAVSTPAEPELFAWRGMHQYAQVVDQQSQWAAVFLSKKQYEEHGHSRCNRFFESSW